jgi:hypothetical protein
VTSDADFLHVKFDQLHELQHAADDLHHKANEVIHQLFRRMGQMIKQRRAA